MTDQQRIEQLEEAATSLRVALGCVSTVSATFLDLVPEVVSKGDDDLALCAEINSLRRVLAGLAGGAEAARAAR